MLRSRGEYLYGRIEAINEREGTTDATYGTMHLSVKAGQTVKEWKIELKNSTFTTQQGHEITTKTLTQAKQAGVGSIVLVPFSLRTTKGKQGGIFLSMDAEAVIVLKKATTPPPPPKPAPVPEPQPEPPTEPNEQIDLDDIPF